MTIQAAALGEPNKLCAVRFVAQAARTVDGRMISTIENRGIRELQIDMERVDRAEMSGSDSKLVLKDQGDSLTIRREMPPLQWMLREPWASIDDTRRYVVFPKGRRAPANQNLTAPFREAIIALDDGLVRGSENQRSLSVWVVRQKGSSEGDQIAIEEFLKENVASVIDELAPEDENRSAESSSDPQAQSVPPPPSTDGPSVSGERDRSMPPEWS